MGPDRNTSPSSTHSHETQLNACSKCKVRKKRCDRVRPRCSNCSRANAECNYEVPSSDAQQKLLIAKLSAENDLQKAQIDQLQQRVDTLATSQTIFFPTPPAISPTTNSLFTFPAPQLDINNAERIVQQLFEGEVDLLNTQQSLLASTAQHLGLPIQHNAMGLSGSSPLNMAPCMVNRSFLPDKATADKMVSMYFDYTNYFHPVLDRETIAEDMALIYPVAPHLPSLLDSLTGPDVRVFRLFMVLAIGCNILPKASVNVDVVKLRDCASAHFAAALRSDITTCMICIVLYCIVSITDSAAMDPYQNIRRAAKLVLTLNFHQDDESLPWPEREARKKVFWSVFSMDRSICFTLVRPVTISESDIATSLPHSVPNLSHFHTAFMAPLALFHQTVLLRRLQGVVVSEISLAPAGTKNAEEISLRVRNQIDSWYESLPRSNPRARVFPYLEVNYHLLLVRLYSPSSLFPHTQPFAMETLRESAYRVIEMYGAEQNDHRIAQNHITLSHIIACCVSLVYTLIEYGGSPENLKLVSWRRKALQQIQSAEQYLTAFCSHAPHAARYPEAFRRLTKDVHSRLKEAEESDKGSNSLQSLPTTLIPPLPQSSNGSDITLMDGLAGLADQQQQFTLPWDMLSGGEEMMGTINGDGNGDDLDDILASFGLGAFSA